MTWIALLKISTVYDTPAVAGFTIAVRIFTFALVPSLGLSGAAATLVGQNLGALKTERAEAAVQVAARINMAALTIVAAVVALFAEPIVRLLTPDQSVLAQAVSALRIGSLILPFYAARVCFGAAFNGAGDTRTVMRTSFIVCGSCRSPLLGYSPTHCIWDRWAYTSLALRDLWRKRP